MKIQINQDKALMKYSIEKENERPQNKLSCMILMCALFNP